MIPLDFRNYPSIRPASEILKSRRSVYSEHSEQLNSWYEDLQRYEKSLEDMAAVTLDQNFKEELQHVDQWFCYLSDAERTATMYTLLQHSSPVQTRFFMNILQQQKRDSILTLSDQDTSPFYQAEKEASQRLMNVIPYKTGHPKLGMPPSVTATPSPSASPSSAAVAASATTTTTTTGPTPTPRTRTTRARTTSNNNQNRHSIAFGDINGFDKTPMFPAASSSSSSASGLYSHQLGSSSSQQLNVPRPATTHSATMVSPRTPAYPRSARSRPSSGIELDSSPDFFSSWRSSMVGSINGGNDRGSVIERPASSLGFCGDGNGSTISITSGGPAFQPWGAPTSKNGSSSNNNNNLGFIDPYYDKPLPLIATVMEKDEGNGILLNQYQKQEYPPRSHRTSVAPSPSTSTSVLKEPFPTTAFTSLTPAHQMQSNALVSASSRVGLSPTSAFAKYYSGTQSVSPVPSVSSPSNYSCSSTALCAANGPKPASSGKNFGAFLDPKDAYSENDHDYSSDHSEGSHHSHRQNGNKHHSPKHRSKSKDKRTPDHEVHMELLNDVPAWFRSMRLHKYNAIFESMQWQDIIKLSDQDLQSKGVAALGARRKMLKVFEGVQEHCKSNDIAF